MIGSVQSTNMMGTYQGMLNVNAQNVARVGFEDTTQQNKPDMTKLMTDQVNIENGFEAQTSAVKTQDSMIGSLLDLKA